MKITISGKPKEIAAFTLKLQRQPKKEINAEVIQKQIDLVSRASERGLNLDDLNSLPALSKALVTLLRL